MTHQNEFQTKPVHFLSLSGLMITGGGIGLILISVFLLSAGTPNPEWPEFWFIRPLLVVPFAGAMGGLFIYLMDYVRYQGGWKKTLAILMSIFGYFIALWMGTVLGLAGTMWH